MLAYAIQALLCMTVVVVLTPLSKVLQQEGAPDWVAMIPLGFASVAFVAMGYFLVRMHRTGSKL